MIADSIKHITLYRGMQPYLDTAIDFFAENRFKHTPRWKNRD